MLDRAPHIDLALYLAEPARVGDLDRDQLASLIGQLEELKAIAYAQLLMPSPEKMLKPENDDEMLTVDVAAAKLSVPPEWLYRRAKKLGIAVKLGDGTLRISKVAL